MTQIKTALRYEDIVLDEPRYSTVLSRSRDCSTAVQLGHHTFDLPIIPSNMRCVIDNKLGYELMQNGYFHIMHRFDDVSLTHAKYVDMAIKGVEYALPHYYSSVSLGVRVVDYIILEKLRAWQPDYITIDIAHGHSAAALEMIEYIKNRIDWNRTGWSPFIIAGNVATPQAVRDLEDAGADAIKVGIGPGKACTTYKQTGFMSPMFTTVQRCAEVATKPIIADGGIRENGDIVKALVAGATMVMAGSIFSACIDSPAKTIIPKLNWKNFKAAAIAGFNQKAFVPPVYYKDFYGSASEFNKGHNRNIEGTLITLEGNGLTILEKMDRIKQGLQSAISYAGCRSIAELNGYPYSIIK